MNEDDLNFELYATIDHKGTPSYGQYSANCYNAAQRTWYHYADTQVSVIRDREEIKSEDSYILFYRQKSQNF